MQLDQTDELDQFDLDTQFRGFLYLIQENLGSQAEDYRNLFEFMRDDHVVDGKVLLGLKRAPAAKGNHHALEGGLLLHYTEMWDAWSALRGTIIKIDDTVNDARVLKGIINHDLHKGYRTYELLSKDPWKAQYAAEIAEKLLEADPRRPKGVHKTLWLLQKQGVVLDELDYNVILNAEGGWSTTQTYWCSVLAKVCYLLDEMSGNVMGRQTAGKLLGHNE